MHKAYLNGLVVLRKRDIYNVLLPWMYTSRNGSEEQVKLLRVDCRTALCSDKGFLLQDDMVTCHSGGAIPFWL